MFNIFRGINVANQPFFLFLIYDGDFIITCSLDTTTESHHASVRKQHTDELLLAVAGDVVPLKPGLLDQCSPLSLVEECRGSALIGREDHGVAPPALLCHKEPARASKAPY